MHAAPVVTARINTAVYNVAITFDGAEGTAGRAEIIETSRPQSNVRSVELYLSGLSEPVAKKAEEALERGGPVDVRVLGFSGAWTVSETLPGEDPEVVSFHLKSHGPILAGMLPPR